MAPDRELAPSPLCVDTLGKVGRYDSYTDNDNPLVGDRVGHSLPSEQSLREIGQRRTLSESTRHALILNLCGGECTPGTIDILGPKLQTVELRCFHSE